MTAPSEHIIRQVRAETGPRTILSFSCGKDAIGAHIAIRQHFDEVVPYYQYLVPGLSFVEESLDYYERKLFGRRILRLPHPTFYAWLNTQVFQTPAHSAVIEAAKLPDFSYLDIHDLVCEAENLEPSTLVASGVRAADSPVRRLALMTHGAVSRNQRQYYPIWDWSKDKLLAEIEYSGIRLPVDYELFGRSFDGLDARFLLPLKRHRPEDYRKILEWFPLADVEVWRYERSRKIAF